MNIKFQQAKENRVNVFVNGVKAEVEIFQPFAKGLKSGRPLANDNWVVRVEGDLVGSRFRSLEAAKVAVRWLMTSKAA